MLGNLLKSSSRGGTRTRTGVPPHWILSPERLPIPPLGQGHFGCWILDRGFRILVPHRLGEGGSDFGLLGEGYQDLGRRSMRLLLAAGELPIVLIPRRGARFRWRRLLCG